ncbi:hypothetical protein ACFS7Z_16810 [Pontibacter toksunensis]|uniref:Lipoprotein n=2 Tax=Pontibacter toksunensis TaxID=1332631 RepID=A0ABW6BXD0_9BACT
MKFKIETKTLNHKRKMKNLFKFAFVALALTAFTACNEEATTEAEAVETEVVTEEEVAPVEEVAPATEEVVVDSTVVVEEAPATEVQ